MAQELDNSEILDFVLDSLEDLPEFYVLPKGVFVLEGIKVSQVQNEVMGTMIKFDYKVVETLELASPETDKEPTVGQEVTWSFALEAPPKKDGEPNDFGTKTNQGYIKMLSAPTGVKTFGGLIGQFPGTKFKVVIAHRKYKDKDGNERVQANFKSVSLV